jgi:hypothetical protein
MLDRLLSRWKGKFVILVLLGFMATDFIITITLSAADATAHLVENPYIPSALQSPEVLLTLALLALLAAVFLRGFGEAIGIAVVLVVVYLGLNLVVVVDALRNVLTAPEVVTIWRNMLTTQYSSVWAMIGISLVVFPKLALGLSGFETGVVVMPQIKGSDTDDPDRPATRIRNTRQRARRRPGGPWRLRSSPSRNHQDWPTASSTFSSTVALRRLTYWSPNARTTVWVTLLPFVSRAVVRRVAYSAVEGASSWPSHSFPERRSLVVRQLAPSSYEISKVTAPIVPGPAAPGRCDGVTVRPVRRCARPDRSVATP